MNAVFADTWYWIALTNVQDKAHQAALSLSRSLKPQTLLTTEAVLTEYLNFFAAWGPRLRRACAESVQAMLDTKTVRIVHDTERLFLAGLGLYAARTDKGYSLTDCISMEVMRQEGVTEVLTSDRHFEQEGFQTLYREQEKK